ncbi:unnamed protein product [Aphis gossypii]|uniref:Uncharacterized protein n=1 Tax=Aphis gossypii TaxID=80765 RepID=A0A9P0J670_APHGO|nr:unnamed protein product [Aphis gossypii]
MLAALDASAASAKVAALAATVAAVAASLAAVAANMEASAAANAAYDMSSINNYVTVPDGTDNALVLVTERIRAVYATMLCSVQRRNGPYDIDRRAKNRICECCGSRRRRSRSLKWLTDGKTDTDPSPTNLSSPVSIRPVV